MSAKACLLCGKSLSRIWSGAGEDFCSREHRNQYRLRRGMDRLHEANKVANVMRRRESPRQIGSSQLINPGAQYPRAFMDPRPVSARVDPALTMPRTAGVFRSRMAANPGPLPALPLPGKAPKARPGAAATLRFPVRRASSAVAIEPRMPARVVQAPFAALSGNPANADYSRRILVFTWRPASRIVLGDMLRRVKRAELNPMDTARTARRLFVPSQGRALRVSLAIGFHIPKSGPPSIEITPPEAAGMTWPVKINLTEEAIDRNRPEPIAGSIPIEIPGMLIPAAPPSNFESGFRWPGAFELPMHFVSPVVRHRTAYVPFGNTDEGLGKEYLNEYRN